MRVGCHQWRFEGTILQQWDTSFQYRSWTCSWCGRWPSPSKPLPSRFASELQLQTTLAFCARDCEPRPSNNQLLSLYCNTSKTYHFQILQPAIDLVRQVHTLILWLRARVDGCSKRFANLSDLSLEAVTLEENDEHVLFQLLASLGILNGIGNISLADEEITTSCTPENTLKGCNFGAVDYTSNISTWY